MCYSEKVGSLVTGWNGERNVHVSYARGEMC